MFKKSEIVIMPGVSIVSAARMHRHRNKDNNTPFNNTITNSFINTLTESKLDDIEENYGDFTEFIRPGFGIKKILGSGKFGLVLSICKSNFNCSAMKLIKSKHTTGLSEQKREVLKEFQMQKLFADVDIAADVIGRPIFYRYNNHLISVIHMHRIDGMLEDLLHVRMSQAAIDNIYEQLLFLIGEMKHHKLTHGDLHTGNIFYQLRPDSDGVLQVRLVLGDFGWSSHKKASTPLEYVQLIRTLGYDKDIDEDNFKYLDQRLRARFTHLYPHMDISTEDKIEDLFEEMHKRYEHNVFNDQYNSDLSSDEESNSSDSDHSSNGSPRNYSNSDDSRSDDESDY